MSFAEWRLARQRCPRSNTTIVLREPQSEQRLWKETYKLQKIAHDVIDSQAQNRHNYGNAGRTEEVVLPPSRRGLVMCFDQDGFLRTGRNAWDKIFSYSWNRKVR